MGVICYERGPQKNFIQNFKKEPQKVLNAIFLKESKENLDKNSKNDSKENLKPVLQKDLKQLIWIDSNIDNNENVEYQNKIKSLGFTNIKCFKTVEEGIRYIKKIKFEKTKIILSGKLYIEFILTFKKNIRDINIIPKIIIFTRNKDKFLESNKDYKNIINDSFYNFGGINNNFEEIKKFLISQTLDNEIKLNNFNQTYELKKTIENVNNKENLGYNRISNDIQLTFEYIDCLEKLELPLLYQSIINLTKIDKIEKYNEYLFSKYSNQTNLKELLYDMKTIPNIPKELLCKYYIRIYTIESDFYRDINNDLRHSKKDNYLPFIKILYEGIKLKTLKIASNNELYRGSRISSDEIDIIKNYLNNKKQNLPGAIVFSKSFLSFTKDIDISKRFLANVLYILEKDDNMDYNLSTHSDIENLSYFENEKEVLFFPFSSFEIIEITETKNNDNNLIYEIRLKYIGKYLQEIKNDKDIIEKAKKIPDSKFKEQILDLGLIQEENLQNTKQIFVQFKKYEEDIKNNNINDNDNNNYIKGIIEINKDNINKKIRLIIINEDDYLKDIVEIKINNNKIQSKCEYGDEYKCYSYYYKFSSEGQYTIEYSFKKILTNISTMFSGCESLISLDLSKFDTKNVTNMFSLFNKCKSLITLDLSNFNTQNVTNMGLMFHECKSLISLDLSNFNTQNVTNMVLMFYDCYLLKSLNLSNFNTQNVTNMEYMFYCCKSLKSLNLCNFSSNNVKNMEDMFSGCESLISLDLSNFNTKNIKYMKNLFFDCISLKMQNVKTSDTKILNRLNY